MDPMSQTTSSTEVEEPPKDCDCGCGVELAMDKAWQRFSSRECRNRYWNAFRRKIYQIGLDTQRQSQ
jgi:hypothetical protein